MVMLTTDTAARAASEAAAPGERGQRTRSASVRLDPELLQGLRKEVRFADCVEDAHNVTLMVWLGPRF